jgi:hypothetical protein
MYPSLLSRTCRLGREGKGGKRGVDANGVDVNGVDVDGVEVMEYSQMTVIAIKGACIVRVQLVCVYVYVL